LRAWKEEMDFKRLVSADPEVRAKMDQEEIDKCFDLSHHLRNVDYVLRRAGVL